jgi:hypothetical protein
MLIVRKGIRYWSTNETCESSKARRETTAQPLRAGARAMDRTSLCAIAVEVSRVDVT